MIFREYIPASCLKAYIKDFYFYDADSSLAYEDVVFPSGHMELIFNLGLGSWQRKLGEVFYRNPAIEIWGQVTRPMVIRSTGRNVMLGVRFYAHTAAYFFSETIANLNDQVIDATELFGYSVIDLHEQLLASDVLSARISLIETYLLQRLHTPVRKYDKIDFIGTIINSFSTDCAESVASISLQNNISSRYLNMLFVAHIGLSPKQFFRISRFKRSLSLVNSSKQKLTDVAYATGYFDQSHFINEFKEFTGLSPNAFFAQISPVNQLLAKS